MADAGVLSACQVAGGEKPVVRRISMLGRMSAPALLFAVLTCTVMGGAAAAQVAALDSTPPSRAQVLQLMSAMGVQQSVDASLRAAEDKLKASARASFEKKNPGADAAALKKLDAVFDSTPLFSFDDIAEAIIPVYQKNLSAGDVQAGIDFYSSEPGKRLLEKVSVIIRERKESGGPLVQQKLKAYSEELERKLEAFQSQQSPQAPQSNAPDGTSKTMDGKTAGGKTK
jgi:hypothetical protein